MARVNLLSQSDLPDEYQYLLSEDAMGEINLLCAMANNPDVLQSYMRYGSTLWDESGLEPAEVEILILAIASHLGAEYEWQQHVPIALDMDLKPSTIRAIADEDHEDLSDRRRAIVQFAIAVTTGEVTQDQYNNLTTHMDERTIIGVTQLATHYLATARFVDALSIPLEDSFVEWDLAELETGD